MDPKQNKFHTEADTYQTGRTQPPKHYSGIIAILLVLVILLSGIATAPSILNFKLFAQLNQQHSTPQVAFSRSADTPESAGQEEDVELPGLGISGTVIPRVYQRYYKLPNGFYVTRVFTDGQAAKKGLLAGDIITAVNGTAITDSDSARAFLESLTPGQELVMTLYRNGSSVTATLIWEE